MAYTWYKLCIIQFLDLYMISSVKQAPTKSQMNGYTSAHVYQGRDHVKVTQRALFTQNVYITVYTWYIPSIYPSFCTSRTRSCPLRRPASLSSLRLGRLAEPLSFGHRQAANARLRAPKWPQPRVDLVNMASFPRGPAWTISAPAVKGRLLSAGVLVRNSGGGIAVQKARNERNPSKKVQNPSNIECGNRGGLVQFSHSIGLHCAC